MDPPDIESIEKDWKDLAQEYKDLEVSHKKLPFLEDSIVISGQGLNHYVGYILSIR